MKTEVQIMRAAKALSSLRICTRQFNNVLKYHACNLCAIYLNSEGYGESAYFR